MQASPPSPDTLAALVTVCRQLRARGLVNATHGNVSVRCGGLMYITPTGCDLATVTADELVAVRLDDGRTVGPGRPSKEWELHLRTYLVRPEAGGIVHAHSPRAVAIGCCHPQAVADAVPAYTLAFAVYTRHLPLLAYCPAGSRQLADSTAAAMRTHTAVLLAHHGLVAAQPTVTAAYYRVEEIEENCAVALQIGLQGRACLDPERL